MEKRKASPKKRAKGVGKGKNNECATIDQFDQSNMKDRLRKLIIFYQEGKHHFYDSPIHIT
jgi:hypothetical protein